MPRPGLDFILLRLVFVRCRRPGLGIGCFYYQRNDLLRGRDLRDHRLEARIEQRADVELAGLETRDHLFGDVLGIDEGKLADCTKIDVLDDLLLERAAQLLIALTADAEEFYFLALVHQRQRALAG